jgi:hypothetical protein
MEVLGLEEAEEADAVKALVTHVVKLQDDLGALDRASRDKARVLLRDETVPEDALRERLDAQRALRRDLLGRLEASRKELRLVVTVRQELELIQMGILK